MQTYIETSRLILRDWKEEDIPAFARMNADPHVMEFFLHPIRPLTKRLYYRMQKVLLGCIRKGNILKLQRIRFICVDVGIPNINHSATDRISTLTGTREKQLLIVLCCKMLRK